MTQVKRKKKRKDSKNKGTSFERAICRKLSLWWSNGEDDSIFWRSPGSGSWARGKRPDTPGRGDVIAVKPEGKSLTDYAVIEIKRGYRTPDSISDNARDNGTLVKFLENLEHLCFDEAHKRYPILIYKKDRGHEMICLPAHMASDAGIVSFISLRSQADIPVVILFSPNLTLSYAIMKLDDFVNNVFPETILIMQ
jgi:hypothetical protein